MANDPDRVMTPPQISDALARLVPTALQLVERSLREVSKPSRATIDTAWQVIQRGLDAQPEAPAVDRDVVELAAVLELVSG